jgi:hypothetical protein
MRRALWIMLGIWGKRGLRQSDYYWAMRFMLVFSDAIQDRTQQSLEDSATQRLRSGKNYAGRTSRGAFCGRYLGFGRQCELVAAHVVAVLRA